MGKKRDLEYIKPVGGLFTLVLLLVDIFYSSWSGVGFFISAVILHVFISLAWVVVLLKHEDPNFDGVRKVLLALILGAIVLVAIHRAVSNEDKSVIIDSEKAKKEQSK